MNFFSFFASNQKKNDRTNRARCRTRKLALESLESRELLTASGWSADPALDNPATIALLDASDANDAEPIPLDGAASASNIVVTTAEDVVDAKDGLISFREAMELSGELKDATGDSSTITFSTLLSGQTITLKSNVNAKCNNVTIKGSGITIEGGGISFGKSGSFSIKNAKLKNCTIYARDANVVKIESCAISEIGVSTGISIMKCGSASIANTNFSGLSGKYNEVLYASQTNGITIDSCNFSACSTTRNIVNLNDCVATLKNVNISNCHAGVIVGATNEVTLDNCDISNNSNNFNLLNDYNNRVVYGKGAKVSIANTKLLNNSGFYYVVSSWGSSLTINACEISDNSSTFGAIFSASDSTTIKNTNIINNTSSRAANDDFVSLIELEGSATLDKCVVSENEAAENLIRFGSSSGSLSIKNNTKIEDNTAQCVLNVCGNDVKIESSVISNNTGIDENCENLIRATGYGGASTSAFSIKNTKIEGNDNFWHSVYAASCVLTTDSCAISENSGNFAIGTGVDATVKNTQIIKNECIRAVDGAGVLFKGNKLTVDSCAITENSSVKTETVNGISQEVGGFGGGLFVAQQSKAVVKNTLIAKNKSFSGAGICVGRYAELEVVNATIVENACVQSESTIGGGLYLYDAAVVDLKNAIVAGNTAGNHFEIYRMKTSTTITGANVLTNFSDWSTEPGRVVPFYSLEETFLNAAAGDYRLRKSSPAVDKGDSSYASSADLTQDLGGRSRIVGGAVDIGAYEWTSSDGDSTSDPHKEYYVSPKIFYDADKRGTSQDANLCWAAAATNALWFTGWGQILGQSDEEDLFHNVIVPNLTSSTNGEGYGSTSYKTFQWFLDGSALIGMTSSVGGYYSNELAEHNETAFDYIRQYDLNSVSNVVRMTEDLKRGCGVAIGIGWCDATPLTTGERIAGHGLSVYGYSYNPNLNRTDPGYITKLYVADSNDYGKRDGRLDRKLQTLNLVWNSSRGAYEIDNYRYKDDSVLLLEHAYVVEPRPDKYGGVPNPPTAPKLSSPSSLLSSSTNTSATVYWKSISNAKSYTVQYRLTGASEWQSVGAQSSATSATISGLTKGKEYEIRVRANGDGGATATSSEFSKTLTVKTQPKLAFPEVSTSATNNSIAVAWTAIEGAKSYTVQYRLRGSSEWRSVGAQASATSATITGLSKGKDYEIQVRANGDGGATQYSSDFCRVLTAKAQPKLARSTLEFVGSTNNSITVAWTPIADAKSFTIQYKLSTASEWQSVGAKSTATSATITGLSKGNDYEIRIRANGDGGATWLSSDYSASLTAKTQAKLARPTLEFVGSTNNSIAVAWTPSEGAKSYTVQYKLTTASEWTNVGVKSTATSATITGLKKGKDYEIRIRANGDGGATWLSSDFSASLTAKTQPKLARPTLVLTGSTNNSITVDWEPSAGATSYAIQYKLTTASEWTNVGVRSTETSKELTGLKKGKDYEIRIRANGDGGKTWYSSDFSGVLTAAVDNRTLAAPSLKVATTTSNSIALSWSAISGAKSYALQYKLSTSDEWSEAISIASSKTTYSVGALKASTQYDFRIRAVGNGSTSFDSKFGETTGTTSTSAKKLAAPQPSVSGSTKTSISLTWRAISGATSYSIEYKLATVSTWKKLSPDATGTSATITGLTSGAKYNIRMVANGDGANYETSDYSATLTRIAAPQLEAPTLKNAGSTNDSIVVAWQKVSGASSYSIQYKLSTASEWTTVGAASTLTSKTISGLTKGKTYEIRIRANGDGGATWLSSEFGATLTATAEPKLAMPQLSARATNGGIEISWTGIDGASSYTLQYRKLGATTWTNKGVRATETATLVDDLASGATYEFRLRANGDGGATCKSSAFSATQTIYLGALSSASEPIESDALPVELVPEFDDDLLTALAENWRR